MSRYKINNSIYESDTVVYPIKRNEVSMDGHTSVGMTKVKDVDKANGIIFNMGVPIGMGVSSDHPSYKAEHIGNLNPYQIKEILDSVLKNGYVDFDKYIEITVTKLKDIPSDKVYYYHEKPRCIGAPIPVGPHPLGMGIQTDEPGYSDFFRTGNIPLNEEDFDEEDFEDEDFFDED